MRIVLLLCVGALLAAGCQTVSTNASQKPTPPSVAAAPGSPNRVDSSNSPVPAKKIEFDGNKAFELLKKQVAFGPRVPGTQSHAEASAFLEAELRKHCDRVERQEFIHIYTGTLVKRLRGRSLKMVNLIGFINPKAATQILLCAHWDTRPVADEDMEQMNHQKPLLGANDGASGVATLLELARALKASKMKVGVVIALFDGEDFGEWIGDAAHADNHMLLGSRHFAKNLPTPRPQKGILLDMIGDADLRLTRDSTSMSAAPELYSRLFDIAAQLGYHRQFPRDGAAQAIQDDHVPLISAGIPTVDLIDFDYVYWHTLGDTVNKCSPASLQAIGSVLETYLGEL